MKTLILVLSLFVSASALAVELPDNTPFWQLGKGSQFVAQRDILLPANTSTLAFERKGNDGFPHFCELSFESDPKVRLLAKETALEVETSLGGQFDAKYLKFAGTEIATISCYRAFNSSATGLNIGQTKNVLKGTFKLVQARGGLAEEVSLGFLMSSLDQQPKVRCIPNYQLCTGVVPCCSGTCWPWNNPSTGKKEYVCR